jgi:hypothetical protein
MCSFGFGFLVDEVTILGYLEQEANIACKTKMQQERQFSLVMVDVFNCVFINLIVVSSSVGIDFLRSLRGGILTVEAGNILTCAEEMAFFFSRIEIRECISASISSTFRLASATALSFSSSAAVALFS